jgi:Tfp pilus assembly protein PilF
VTGEGTAVVRERTLEDVVVAMQKAKEGDQPCSVLIGAGCSTPEIPLANGFVEAVKNKGTPEYDLAYARARKKTYPYVMKQLLPAARFDLIASYVEGARINWTHVLLAWLVKKGYVGRILTTNFDNLVLRACGLYHLHPAVYDLAASSDFQAGRVYEPSVFFLHGQHRGFVQLHTPEQVESQAEKLRPAFDAAALRRPWLVVGYSGESDPVFENLARIPCFDDGLFWVGYEDNDPVPSVKKRLLEPENHAYLVRGFDSDRFFLEVTRKLGLETPLVQDPFIHPLEVMRKIAPLNVKGKGTQVPAADAAVGLLESARAQFVLKDSPESAAAQEQQWDLAQASKWLVEGKYEDIVALRPVDDRDIPARMRDILAWGYIELGNALLKQARAEVDEEANRLFALAGGEYEQALGVKPDQDAALHNWGNALSAQARQKSGDEADRLFKLAGEKYGQALGLKPDHHATLNNWGNALSAQARQKSGDEADRLFGFAGEKYEQAIANQPDDHEALSNWGLASLGQAEQKSGAEADGLFARANEKYEQALAIKPDDHSALNNWGTSLLRQGKQRSGADADRLFVLAGKKYEQALAIKPEGVFFNLACLAAVRGDVDGTLSWLERRVAVEPPLTQQKIAGDSDFDLVREDELFVEFVATLPKD